MALKDRPTLRLILQLGTVLLFVVLAAVAYDLLSRLGVHHPNLAGIITLSILAVIFALGWVVNRRRAEP
jgi:uncharacterized membrane protein YoaK (UPF0700 family)